MVDSADVPTRFEPCPSEAAIDANWLAVALGRPGELERIERRSIGTGQVGENVRYTLTWKAGAAAPATVVGKFPSLDEVSFETAKVTDSYVREVGFYRDMKSTVSIRTPHVYYLGEALEENRFVLIMEDIAPAEQGDQIEGTDPERARMAVAALPGLHGPHWGADFQDRYRWSPIPDEDAIGGRFVLYQMVFDAFVERYSARLAPEVIEFGRWLLEAGPQLAHAFRSPLTITHGDYRLDNMLFSTGPGSPPLTIVDWQTANLGYGPADLAYFVGAGLLPDARRAIEAELVDLYISGLQDVGALLTEQAVADARHDYVVGTFGGYFMAVVASQIVGQTERGDEMFCVMAERHAAHAEDNGIRDLLR